MRDSVKIALLKLISSSFEHRPIPSELTLSKQLTDDEYSEINSFQNKYWSEITCEQLDYFYDIIFWLSPEAFCFYLPGILSAGIKEDRTDLLIYSSILGMLDRSPNPAYWDNFFLERWPLLTESECKAVQDWVLWLASNEETVFYKNTLDRVLETLELLKQGITAIKSN